MLERVAKCEPAVTSLVKAHDRGLSGRTLSHAGSPFTDRRLIPRPVLHALAGSAVIEGWVKTFDDGIAAILAGDIALEANHSIRRKKNCRPTSTCKRLHWRRLKSAAPPGPERTEAMKKAGMLRN